MVVTPLTNLGVIARGNAPPSAAMGLRETAGRVGRLLEQDAMIRARNNWPDRELSNYSE